MSEIATITWWIAALGAVALLCSCDRSELDMLDQPKVEAFAPTDSFDSGPSSRPQPPGTVALEDPPPGAAGIEVDLDLLWRGRERFDIYCSVCHGRAGDGDGMAVQRGFPRPTSLHDPRLRDETADEHIRDVIEHGFGKMPAYGERMSDRDAWAIVAYVRALQLGRHVSIERLPDELRRALAARPAQEPGP